MTNYDERPTMTDRVRELNISLRVTSALGMQRDDDGWYHYPYRVTLSRKGHGSMRLTWRQGTAHTNDPNVVEVLDCLASDAAGFVNAQGFEDWCSEYGYDSDSRKAEKIYRAVERQTDSLRRVLGDDFETVLFETENL
jgi:hypothetical protein